MSKLWVKFQEFKAVKVSVEGCEDVEDLLVACIKKLPRVLGSFDSAQLFLSTTVDGDPLRPGLPLTGIPGYSENNDEHPLYIHVIQQEMLSNIFTQGNFISLY